MALHGNYSVLHKSPATFIGGGIISGAKSGWNKHGISRNFGLVVGTDAPSMLEKNLSAIPHGSTTGGAWLFARTDGGRHARSEIFIGASATGALGRNMVGNSTMTIGASGVGGLIAGGVGTAALSIGASADIAATVGGVGTAAISLSASAVTGALGWLQGESTLQVSGTLESYALGWMTGTTEESGMTAAGIANTVWSKIIEGPYSADQILRLLAAHAAGAATGLEGANPQFTGLDGVTLRIDGTYAAGNRTIDSLNGA